MSQRAFMAHDKFKTLEEVEGEHIVYVFERVGGNMTHCAAALGIDRRTLYRKARALGLATRNRPGRPPTLRERALESRVAELEAELAQR